MPPVDRGAPEALGGGTLDGVIQVLLAVPVVAVPVYLVWASWRGRVQVRCCGVDARHDKRMRAAFDEDPAARV